MLTLLEWSKSQSDELVSSVVEIFATSSPILVQMPWKEITKSSPTLDKFTKSLYIIGGEMDVDKFLAETDNSGARARYIAMKTKSLALYTTKMIFDGDNATNSNQFNGINKLLEGTNQEVTASTNGLELSSTNYDAFIDALEETIDAVDSRPDVIYMSKAMRRIVWEVLRSKSAINYTENSFGQKVLSWGEIPIEVIDVDNAGNTILGQDEDCGTAPNTGSIYAVKYGVDSHFSGIRSSNIQVADLGELDSKPAYRTRFELYGNIVIWHPRSVSRLKGLIIPTS